MSRYAKANIYVGKYRVPKDGHIQLPDSAKVRFLHEAGDTGNGKAFAEYGDGPLWLIVEDGDFWPVMIRLDVEVVIPKPRYWTMTGTTSESITVSS